VARVDRHAIASLPGRQASGSSRFVRRLEAPERACRGVGGRGPGVGKRPLAELSAAGSSSACACEARGPGTRSSGSVYLWTNPLGPAGSVRARRPGRPQGGRDPGKGSGRSTPSPRWSSNSRRRRPVCGIGALGDPRAPPAGKPSCIRLLHAHRRPAPRAAQVAIQAWKSPPPSPTARSSGACSRRWRPARIARRGSLSRFLTAGLASGTTDGRGPRWRSTAGPSLWPATSSGRARGGVLLRSSRGARGARGPREGARRREAGLRIGEASRDPALQARAQRS